MAKDDIVHFELESGVSAFDQTPFVNIHMKRRDGRSQSMQLRPNKAREIAIMLFESAVEAERDASLMAGTQEMGIELEEAGMLLNIIRGQREKWEDLE